MNASVPHSIVLHTLLLGLAVITHSRADAVAASFCSPYAAVHLVSCASFGVMTPQADAETQLRRVGISPALLCALQVDSTTFLNIATTAAAWTLTNGQSIQDTDIALATATAQVRTAEAAVSRSRSTANRNALHDARQSLLLAQSSRQALDDALASAISALLTPDQQARLATSRLNEHIDVPIALKLVERPCDEWIRIRDARSQRHTCLADGSAVPQEVADYLSLVEGDTVTASALSAMENLEGVELAWRSAFDH
jgi:hypothetical protein